MIVAEGVFAALRAGRRQTVWMKTDPGLDSLVTIQRAVTESGIRCTVVASGVADGAYRVLLQPGDARDLPRLMARNVKRGHVTIRSDDDFKGALTDEPELVSLEDQELLTRASRTVEQMRRDQETRAARDCLNDGVDLLSRNPNLTREQGRLLGRIRRDVERLHAQLDSPIL